MSFLEICGNDLGCHIFGDTTGIQWVESGGASQFATVEMDTQVGNFPVSCMTFKYLTEHSLG